MAVVVRKVDFVRIGPKVAIKKEFVARTRVGTDIVMTGDQTLAHQVPDYEERKKRGVLAVKFYVSTYKLKIEE